MDLRTKFLDYFARHQHARLSSSGLVPLGDPTLLFTNAGMVQFKDIFTGGQKRDVPRACTVQKCLRVGGKHNDLENVGHTARHHTFFEMLGNFSFGDYFKEEAITFAWDFLTREVALNADRLHITVFEEDDEAADLWQNKIGVPRERIRRAGEKDNFWAMGPTGPCGPCSEIHYDQGPGNWDCPDPHQCSPLCDCDRYLEIWNLVFMQFNRRVDGTMAALPNPSIDTGMGLERLQAVVEGKRSNYDSSLFQPLLQFLARLSGTAYGASEQTDAAMRVMADHSRAIAFLIAEGVLPGNEGRGYVVRRLVRRALRYARLLGFREPVLAKITNQVVEQMGSFYPELIENRASIERFTGEEEELFLATIASGMKKFEELVDRAKSGVIGGEEAFRLYDTFGFPLDLTQLMARESGLTVDQDGFDQAMAEQRQRARAAAGFQTDYDNVWVELAQQIPATRFSGYTRESDQGSVLYLTADSGSVDCLSEGASGIMIIDATPLYAESGGQVGDRGHFQSLDGSCYGTISGCRKGAGKLFLHTVTVEKGELRTGMIVELEVDHSWRSGCQRNHTATHLLQAALRTVLGSHIQQAGSLVQPDRLRFDFSHRTPLTLEERQQIEFLVQNAIAASTPVNTAEMGIKEALDSGAMAFFGEKYGAAVRVVSVGDFSRELCGGTHVRHTGEIGSFVIASEGSVASGVRRIEARVGPDVLPLLQEARAQLQAAADAVKVPVGQLLPRLHSLTEELESARKLRQQADNRAAGDLLENWRTEARVSALGPVVAQLVGEVPVAQLRLACDRVRATSDDAILILAATEAGKLNLIVNLGKAHAGRLHAGNLVREMVASLGGRGGGNPMMGQSGGLQPADWPVLLKTASAAIGIDLS